MRTKIVRTLMAATGLLILTGLRDPAWARTVVTLNITQIVATIDPAKIADFTDYLAAVNLYDGLTHVDPAGHILPRLAQSWDMSPDGLRITFHLNPSARFQDGSAVTATDVTYSLKRLMVIDRGPAALLAGVIGPDAAVALDEHTVQITLYHRFSPFLAITPLILVVNSHEAEAHTVHGDWAQEWLADHTASGGPYAVRAWDHAGGMTLSRFEGYAGGWPAQPIDEVRLALTSDEASVLAMAASGELTMSSPFQTGQTYAALQDMPRFKLQEQASADAFYLKMNSKVAPTDDLHIRRAIACALDYDTIRQQILPGDKLAGPLPSMFAAFHLATLKPAVQDLSCAKAEFSKSKYAASAPVKLMLTYVGWIKFEEEVALLVRSALVPLGFDVTLDPQPWDSIIQLASNVETTPPLTEVFFAPTYPSPDSMFYAQYASKAAGSWASMEWLLDADIDKLIAEARDTYDEARLAEIYGTLQTRLVAMQSDAYLAVRLTRTAMDKCVQGFQVVPLQGWSWDFSRLAWKCPH